MIDDEDDAPLVVDVPLTDEFGNWLHGFCWMTNSGGGLAFSSERITSQKMREMSAKSGSIGVHIV